MSEGDGKQIHVMVSHEDWINGFEGNEMKS